MFVKNIISFYIITMSIASLKQLASVFSNCPEDNKNECVDREKHIQVSDFNMLKEILKEGEYSMEGVDYNKKESCTGETSITHASNIITVDHTILINNEVIPRFVTISMDSSNRIYSNSTTQGENYTAKKQLKVISISSNEVIFSGNGSSTSTENYYCGANIKKIIKAIDDNTFSIETIFGGEKAYHETYTKKQVSVGGFVGGI